MAGSAAKRMKARTIVITGASSGIGAALARHYAASGTLLALVGRHAERLDDVAGACRKAGAEVRLGAIDVRDAAAMEAFLLDIDRDRPIDLVIANAGIAHGTSPGGSLETAEGARAQIETNLLGALNTVDPVVPDMVRRRRGQIALMSSLAAFAPLPDSAAYSASKAALLAYGLALRERLRPDGVQVSVACPGYVATPMGQRYRGWRPLEVGSAVAAARIAKGLARNKAIIAFPLPLAALARLTVLLPEGLRRAGLGAFRFSVDDQRGSTRS